MIIDELIEKIEKTNCRICVGLDTKYDYLPDGYADKSETDALKRAAGAILQFNKEIVDAVFDVCPCVKVQAAYYEMYGAAGMEAFAGTIHYAKRKGMTVIADVKRNDIGSTASAYAAAYLNGSMIDGERLTPFDADMITVNAYLGSDGIKPFLSACESTGKGIFILVKTSNPSSGEFQDRLLDASPLYEQVGKSVSAWGKDLVGVHGYSSVGAVVGATYPAEAEKLRALMPNTFFLIPGYGAQGATAADVTVSFRNGRGGIVNSSRAILLAYREQAFKSADFALSARQALLNAKNDINQYL